ncbi:DUF3619 family protein [Uliginosibacterium sediminicola]|uniref:DUF3619 family protein n=1 Tax=Uliginosibacterium sediminicola TaxID=2024550 RepID=A0ABU9Z1L6_9RHOO
MSTYFEPDNQEELLFAHKLRNKLNAASATLDKDTAERLFAARQAALARHTNTAGVLSLAGFGRNAMNFGADYLRPMLAALALLAFIFCGDYFGSIEHISELEEVDSGLLADDLPINAYLDRGFDTWLSSSAQR